MSASAETETAIDTSLYHVIFTNRGGVVKSWVLKKYRDDSGKPLELINSDATDVPRPFAIELRDQKLTIDESRVLLKFYENGLEGYTYLE